MWETEYYSESCYKSSFNADTGFTTSYFYIQEFADSPIGYDIACQLSSGDIWMATDNTLNPVTCYDYPTGEILTSLPANIGIGECCRGLTFETGSNHLLWISNNLTNKIYCVDLYATDLSEEYSDCIEAPAELTSNSNPFNGSVLLKGQGFGIEPILEIFDSYGRLVLSETFIGTHLWDASAEPTGLYFAVVKTAEGVSDALRLVKF